MTARAKQIGEKYRFDSNHWDVVERSGQTAEIVAVHNEPGRMPYTIAFVDGKRIQAVDRELVDL